MLLQTIVEGKQLPQTSVNNADSEQLSLPTDDRHVFHFICFLLLSINLFTSAKDEDSDNGSQFTHHSRQMSRPPSNGSQQGERPPDYNSFTQLYNQSQGMM